jgi:hypothetical protein
VKHQVGPRWSSGRGRGQGGGASGGRRWWGRGRGRGRSGSGAAEEDAVRCGEGVAEGKGEAAALLHAGNGEQGISWALEHRSRCRRRRLHFATRWQRAFSWQCFV